jgi:hypothetical protein
MFTTFHVAAVGQPHFKALITFGVSTEKIAAVDAADAADGSR